MWIILWLLGCAGLNCDVLPVGNDCNVCEVTVCDAGSFTRVEDGNTEWEVNKNDQSGLYKAIGEAWQSCSVVREAAIRDGTCEGIGDTGATEPTE